jgi:uncharacterized protein YabE (DUF348 family)
MIRFFIDQKYKLLAGVASLMVLSFVLASHVYANDEDTARDGRLITIYDRGDERVILSHGWSVGEALKDAGITVAPKDVVEPGVNTELLATTYVVNIYRSRPVIVVDGAVRQKIMTAAQTPRSIVASAGITELKDEDKTALAASGNIAEDGASTILTIDRAVPFTLQLYGTPTQTYSHADTVGEMLTQKGVKLSAEDTISVDLNTPLTAGMTVAIWRNGVQTATVEEPIAFPVRQVIDLDQPVGYHNVQTPGTNGHRSVTYQITALGGRETGRKVIQSVTLSMPKEQIEIMGAKPGPNALSKAKGAQYYTDSKGISHRETYYDLNMGVVIGACGGGGYTVRADGAKVDKDGYILIAANYGNYPRCSVVETSMGLGKVYDTGGFAARHPHGFDLATDWSNPDGR